VFLFTQNLYTTKPKKSSTNKQKNDIINIQKRKSISKKKRLILDFFGVRIYATQQ
jgi:hypothetical protein